MRTPLHGHQNRSRIAAISVAILVAVSGLTLVVGGSAQAAPALEGDGTTSTTAGASCWGIKQQHPSTTSGLYWLNTAALARPQQFSCDMTTDGGGWVLVGRGRQGWTFNPLGQGSAQTVRTTIDGPAAFAPAALDTDTIDALLNGQATNALADGIRLERATDTTGTTRQNYTLFPRHSSWTWSFASGQLLNRVVIDGTTFNGSNTRDTSESVAGQTTNQLGGIQGIRRLFTWRWSSHANQAGFSFGDGVSGGSNAATNYLWTNGNEGHPIPFTRVWIRPQIANSAAGFSPIPAGGYAAQAKPTQLKNRSEVANWGVVGLNRTNEPRIEPYHTGVLAIRVSGDRTFVGGRFTGVQNGPGATPIAQQSLAAFTLDGTWIDTFRPQINGRVWDMVVTPDNKLIIAGDFTSVNGVPDTQGMAALNPITGEVITSWKARAYRADGSRSLVRALGIRGNVVYAAGTFNRVQGGTWNPITTTHAVAVSSVSGAPSTWRPRPNGSTVRLRVSDDGTRVLLAGYFTSINGDANHGFFGITDATTGNPVPGIGPWIPSTGSGARYQQAVEDLGDGRYVVGGSEHNIQLWDANRTSLLDAAVTRQGGDTQAIEEFDGVTYIGCHCGDWVYEGTNNWSSPNNFRAVEPINLVGAWNNDTWSYDTNWYPSSLKGARGDGIWTIDKDARGCLWVGGDLNRGSYSGNAATDWLGGFARFCQEDATAPTTPTNFTAVASGSGVRLDWGASTDASGTVSYDIYKNDRAIATVFGRTYTDPDVTGSHRYTVRATDARGNRSASPAPISVNGPTPVLAQPVAFGSTWRYLSTGADAGTAWRAPGFADGSWPAGPGRLGWGVAGIATNVGAARPLTTYYRHTFEVADPSQARLLDLRVIALQGAVVYVNGIEAGRLNMGGGLITSTTAAASYLPTAQEQTPRSIAVPASLLVAGTNTIAIEVHSVTAGAGRQLFDLEATLYGTGGDTVAPSAPTLSVAPGSGLVDLSWTPATDDVALGGYLIRRNGQPYAVTGPSATAYRDGVVDLGVPQTYTVSSFDMTGNVAISNTAAINPQADPNVLAYRSPWKWFYAEGGPGAGWQTETFNDTTWASGPGELGYGDNDESTLISTSPTPRPLTAYFRTTVTIDNPTAFTTVLADLVRDDGAVLYINGTEVGRDNLPAGPIAFTTPALTTLSDRTAERTPVRFTIPATAFKPGPNVIAVEIHNSDRWSGDLSMDLKLTGQP